MLKIRLKPFSDHMKYKRDDEPQPPNLLYVYAGCRGWINRFNCYHLLTIMSFLFGLFFRGAMVLSLSLILFGIYLYLRAYRSAFGIRLSRVLPEKTIERELIKVKIRIENLSPFTVYDLMIKDQFSASLDAQVAFPIKPALPPGAVYEAEYVRRCNAGMGVFDIGPLEAHLTDPLGIFQFLIETRDYGAIEVFPKLEPIPHLPIPAYQGSFTYGIFETPDRGESQNFMGIREFVRGDSLRKVAWRRSVRAGKLLVKDFEKIINTDITFLLEMNTLVHAGRKSESTWEYSKDMMLAMMAQQVAYGNEIQLCTNQTFIPFGRGEDHHSFLVHSIYSLRPVTDPHPENLVDRHRSVIPPGTTAIYLAPVLGRFLDKNLDSLLRLKANDVQVLCILSNAPSFIQDRVHGTMQLMVNRLARENQEKINTEYLYQLECAEIPTYIVDAKQKLSDSILKRHQHQSRPRP